MAEHQRSSITAHVPADPPQHGLPPLRLSGSAPIRMTKFPPPGSAPATMPSTPPAAIVTAPLDPKMSSRSLVQLSSAFLSAAGRDLTSSSERLTRGRVPSRKLHPFAPRVAYNKTVLAFTIFDIRNRITALDSTHNARMADVCAVSAKHNVLLDG
ncbi:hypothetical protein D9619_011961 [Psilocybe cf. subviscida]|uniref:Uncharacterized protein n=1 Tax=Psilocybe cf. subviscida TaxID=2480587 RepID=A0A8H5EVQ5_9AGAR|nr:hypothetical protein D9619_011961 [Psilocybe cf. subviscida]